MQKVQVKKMTIFAALYYSQQIFGPDLCQIIQRNKKDIARFAKLLKKGCDYFVVRSQTKVILPDGEILFGELKSKSKTYFPGASLTARKKILSQHKNSPDILRNLKRTRVKKFLISNTGRIYPWSIKTQKQFVILK